jgi:hypothetical protein
MNNEDSYKKYLLRCFENIKKTRKIEIESNGTHAKIQCFNLQHKGGMESDPSFRVNLVKNGNFRAGSGRCHTCGMFIGSWPKILEAIKRPDLIIADSQFEEDEYISVKGDKKGKLLDNLLGSDDDTAFMATKDFIPWPEHRIWRGIQGKLVAKIGGKLYFDEELETQMLYLPCIVNGQEVGGIRANIEKRGKLNYFNLPGDWVKNKGLFPYDYTLKMLEKTGIRTLVLTEGVRDPLNSIQNSIPSMAILGTNNWSEVKVEFVLSLPIDRIVLAFDPDEAGEKATKMVYKTLKDEIPVRRFDFSKYGDDIDPGCMSTKIARKLRNLSLGEW